MTIENLKCNRKPEKKLKEEEIIVTSSSFSF
jgi:hypothetical protein